MLTCFKCKKIIFKNSAIFMFQDNSFCSIDCRKIFIDYINDFKNNIK